MPSELICVNLDISKITQMIAVTEAGEIISKYSLEAGIISLPLAQSINRVLKEDIYADRDFPPFNRVMMDGIAVNHTVFRQKGQKFKIEGMQAAGAPQMKLENDKNCLEVMTGAMLPIGTDAVVRYEDIKMVSEGEASVDLDEILPFQNVHLKGTDRKAGSLLVKSGTLISPAEVAVLATVGKPNVQVSSPLKVTVVSTGDELVNVDEAPHPYQIRQSNSLALEAALGKFPVTTQLLHIADDKQEIKHSLKRVLEESDLVMLSGGVSRGKKDYVPEVLEGLGVKKHFHRVAQRPGKPLWFGSGNDGKVVFGLPGNPVSTFLCFYKYVLPWLYKSLGINQKVQNAVLDGDFTFKPSLTYFLQVKISVNNGKILATPVTGKGSGDLANLLKADGFLELPAHKDIFKKGEVYPLINFR